MSRGVSLILLLALAFVVSASSRTLTAETDLTSQTREGRELSDDAAEHQRVLAELEQVHQLRERMLQEGRTLPKINRLCLLQS